MNFIFDEKVVVNCQAALVLLYFGTLESILALRWSIFVLVIVVTFC